jgi:hypothetical protein
LSKSPFRLTLPFSRAAGCGATAATGRWGVIQPKLRTRFASDEECGTKRSPEQILQLLHGTTKTRGLDATVVVGEWEDLMNLFDEPIWQDGLQTL